VNVDQDTVPSLITPDTRPNTIFSPDRRLGGLAGNIYRSEALGPGYTVNYKSLYFACATVVAEEPVPLPCTVSFTSDTGATLDVESPGDGSMVIAELNFKDSYSLAMRIESVGDVQDIAVKRATLFVDSFRYAVNPDPPAA
jgi:hypothetical protein